MPPLSSLIAFEAAARLSSFSLSADELLVSREAVSRQIRGLEDFLGKPLFDRESNSVTLNEMGQQYYGKVGPNLTEIALATLNIVNDVDRQLEHEGMGTTEALRHTILIVDDTPNNLIYLHDLLGDEYNVIAAKTAQEALKLITKNDEIDLILLDICMPDVDGYVLCQQLKSAANTKDTPVIFVTSLSDPVDEIKGFEVGASDFLTRPIVPSVMRARIKVQIELCLVKRALEALLQSRTEKLKEAMHLMTRLTKDIGNFDKDIEK